MSDLRAQPYEDSDLLCDIRCSGQKLAPQFRKNDHSKFLLKGTQANEKMKWNMVPPF